MSDAILRTVNCIEQLTSTLRNLHYLGADIRKRVAVDGMPKRSDWPDAVERAKLSNPAKHDDGYDGPGTAWTSYLVECSASIDKYLKAMDAADASLAGIPPDIDIRLLQRAMKSVLEEQFGLHCMEDRRNRTLYYIKAAVSGQLDRLPAVIEQLDNERLVLIRFHGTARPRESVQSAVPAKPVVIPVLDVKRRMIVIREKEYPLSDEETNILDALIAADGTPMKREDLARKDFSRPDKLLRALKQRIPALKKHIVSQAGPGGGTRFLKNPAGTNTRQN